MEDISFGAAPFPGCAGTEERGWMEFFWLNKFSTLHALCCVGMLKFVGD